MCSDKYAVKLDPLPSVHSFHRHHIRGDRSERGRMETMKYVIHEGRQGEKKTNSSQTENSLRTKKEQRHSTSLYFATKSFSLRKSAKNHWQMFAHFHCSMWGTRFSASMLVLTQRVAKQETSKPKESNTFSHHWTDWQRSSFSNRNSDLCISLSLPVVTNLS